MFRSIVTLLKKLAAGNENEVVLALRQPLTAKQLTQKLDLRPAQSTALLERLNEIGLVRPLNPFARASRLYWPTRIGKEFSNELGRQAGLPPTPSLPKLNWPLYGSLCFCHRSAVLRTLTREMRPATIKRKACFNDPELTMSFNNVRDTVRYLEANGLLERVYLRKKAHPAYRVTEKGIPYQRLLQQAEVVD